MNKGSRETGVLTIGKIVGVHGIKGALRVYSHVESLRLFMDGAPLMLRHPDGWERTCALEWIKPHKRGALAAMEGIETRNDAEALVGAEFITDESNLPDLEYGTWYWRDLIGMSVFTIEGRCLGRLESIIETGSNDVYVIKDRENEILVPALESVVVEVDPEAGTMRVDLPEGL